MERSPSEWLKEYREALPKFRWMLEQYYPKTLDLLEATLENPNTTAQEKAGYIINILNDIWFNLPDSKFNIRVNPPGWKAFLNLLES